MPSAYHHLLNALTTINHQHNLPVSGGVTQLGLTLVTITINIVAAHLPGYMAIWWLRRATPNSAFIHTTKFANRRGVGVARHVHILSLNSNFVPRNDMAVVYIAAVHFDLCTVRCIGASNGIQFGPWWSLSYCFSFQGGMFVRKSHAFSTCISKLAFSKLLFPKPLFPTVCQATQPCTCLGDFDFEVTINVILKVKYSKWHKYTCIWWLSCSVLDENHFDWAKIDPCQTVS